MPVVKAASAPGLLSVSRFPGLARLDHVHADRLLRAGGGLPRQGEGHGVPASLAASSFLALFGAMTVKGPPSRP